MREAALRPSFWGWAGVFGSESQPLGKQINGIDRQCGMHARSESSVTFDRGKRCRSWETRWRFPPEIISLPLTARYRRIPPLQFP